MKKREEVASMVIVSNKERKQRLRKREMNIKMASHTMRSNEVDKSLCSAKRNRKGVTGTKKLWLIVKYITQ